MTLDEMEKKLNEKIWFLGNIDLQVSQLEVRSKELKREAEDLIVRIRHKREKGGLHVAEKEELKTDVQENHPETAERASPITNGQEGI